MAYTLHNFQAEDKLYARQLNEMDVQIRKNEMASTKIVAVQETEPTDPDAKIWLDSTNNGSQVALATMADLDELRTELRALINNS